MTANLQQLIAEAQALSPQEQAELVTAVTHLLRGIALVPSVSTDFWEAKTLDRLVDTQSVQPVADMSQLVLTTWPEDETADDVIAYLQQQRHLDR